MKYIIVIISLFFFQDIAAQDYPEVIPEFKIFDLEGESFTSKDVKSKGYSLFIYFNPECGHCKSTFEALNLKAKDIKDKNVILYPVSSNTKEKTISFFEKLAPDLYALDNIKIILDDDFKFADMFFVGGYPTSYLYNEDKKFIKVYNGTSETVSFMEDIK